MKICMTIFAVYDGDEYLCAKENYLGIESLCSGQGEVTSSTEDWRNSVPNVCTPVDSQERSEKMIRIFSPNS